MFKKTIRVLVIEDEPIAQRVLLKMLEKKGYAVDLAKNAKIALEMAKYNYHLIIIDYGLPKDEGLDLDGMQVAKEIRQWERIKAVNPRPIIMVSGYQKDEETVLKTKEAGINDYYMKPLSLNALDDILEKYVISSLTTEELNL